MAPVTHEVYFDIDINGKDAGRITIGLFGTVVPETVHNFVDIAAGTAFDDGLSYTGNPFHRIIKGFMAQGGDITNQDGSGGKSIFGRKFPDENFILKHDRDHVLSMANSGADTNGSQFFITFEKTPWLNGKHVVFGEVLSGFETLHKMEAMGSPDGKPKKPVTIRKSGVIDQSRDGRR
uniref:Peptidyl-prolyl cis-trans isomerase n=1 Tax=Euplotes crassus TaxID=5936 RepID=A0A7S3KRY9_EUPCR